VVSLRKHSGLSLYCWMRRDGRWHRLAGLLSGSVSLLTTGGEVTYMRIQCIPSNATLLTTSFIVTSFSVQTPTKQTATSSPPFPPLTQGNGHHTQHACPPPRMDNLIQFPLSSPLPPSKNARVVDGRRLLLLSQYNQEVQTLIRRQRRDYITGVVPKQQRLLQR
jgi:hypothetical protein